MPSATRKRKSLGVAVVAYLWKACESFLRGAVRGLFRAGFNQRGLRALNPI
jgi:hypothetical protein